MCCSTFFLCDRADVDTDRRSEIRCRCLAPSLACQASIVISTLLGFQSPHRRPSTHPQNNSANSSFAQRILKDPEATLTLGYILCMFLSQCRQQTRSAFSFQIPSFIHFVANSRHTLASSQGSAASSHWKDLRAHSAMSNQNFKFDTRSTAAPFASL